MTTLLINTIKWGKKTGANSFGANQRKGENRRTRLHKYIYKKVRSLVLKITSKGMRCFSVQIHKQIF